jgi:ribosomal protein L2
MTYILTSDAHNLMNYVYNNFNKKLKKLKFRPIFLVLFRIKKLSFISCLELLISKGAQYSRSSGTKSKLLRIDHLTHSALVQLPSGVKKLFSYYSFAVLGQLSISMQKKYVNGKAGF